MELNGFFAAKTILYHRLAFVLQVTLSVCIDIKIYEYLDGYNPFWLDHSNMHEDPRLYALDIIDLSSQQEQKISCF